MSGFMPGPRAYVAGSEDGPLAGLSFALKDNFDLVGHATSLGNPTWAATHPVPTQTAPVVTTLLAAGASCAGKTICDELAFSLVGDNIHYGTPVNPQAPGRIVGGSTSGSASVVAGGEADFGLGSDTAGSIRIPAHHCGLWGLRPTQGRIATTGMVPLAPTYDAPGWLARDPGVFRRVSQVLLGDQLDTKRLSSLTFPAWAFQSCSSAFSRAVRAALARLAHRHRLEVLTHTTEPDWFKNLGELFRLTQCAEVALGVGRWAEEHKPVLAPDIKERLAACNMVTVDRSVLRSWAAAREAISDFLAKLGEASLLCWPAAPGLPPLTGMTAAQRSRYRAGVLRISSLAGVGGLPQLVAPLIRYRGLRLGLSFVAPRFGDSALLSLVPGGKSDDPC